jgi:hypothetical protein
MPIAIKQPLTNVQLELLKTFSHQLPDNDLLELRKILAAFFAQRLIEQANQVWDEQHWNDEKVDEILNTKMRKITKQ